MGIIIGIDVGISTTKIVGIDNKRQVVAPIRIKATDPVTSLYGAFGKYLYDNNIHLQDVEKVMLTGVGSAYIDSPVYGLPTGRHCLIRLRNLFRNSPMPRICLMCRVSSIGLYQDRLTTIELLIL